MLDACLAQLVKAVERQSKDPGSNPGTVENVSFFTVRFLIIRKLRTHPVFSVVISKILISAYFIILSITDKSRYYDWIYAYVLYIIFVPQLNFNFSFCRTRFISTWHRFLLIDTHSFIFSITLSLFFSLVFCASNWW